MKCVHCEYEHGWSSEKMEKVVGKEGEFYELSNDVKFERNSYSYYGSGKATVQTYACPSCMKIFIADW